MRSSSYCPLSAAAAPSGEDSSHSGCEDTRCVILLPLDVEGRESVGLAEVLRHVCSLPYPTSRLLVRVLEGPIVFRAQRRVELLEEVPLGL